MFVSAAVKIQKEKPTELKTINIWYQFSYRDDVTKTLLQKNFHQGISGQFVVPCQETNPTPESRY